MANKDDTGVQIVNAALYDDAGNIGVRGNIVASSLPLLKVDTYQREFLGCSSRKGHKTSLYKAVEEGKFLPDIELGMRGKDFSERRTRGDKGDCIVLKDDVYIIDGFQRVGTLLSWIEKNPDQPLPIQLGAKIHFNTTHDWEMDQFRVLNANRIPVSPNILLRNARETSHSILTLYGLSHNDRNAVLYHRVCWDQRMKVGELFTALMLCRVARTLHRYERDSRRSSSISSSSVVEIPKSLDKATQTIGLQTFRQNVVTFFDVLDECFGIRGIVYREKITQTRGNFLLALTAVFASHKNFWAKDEIFTVSAPLRTKLKAFPINDPTIMQLSGAGSSAMPLLIDYIKKHFNKGKSVNKLSSRMIKADAED